MSRLIRTDFHVHTNLSDCGHPQASLEAVLRGAQEAELEAVGVADHVFLPEHRARPRTARGQLPKQVGGLRVYVSCEAEMRSPTETTIDAAFAQELDYVVMSASHLYNVGVWLPQDLDLRGMAAYVLELTRGAIESGLADIVAHPMSVPACPVTFEELVESLDLEAWKRTAEAAAKAGVAIECNPRYLRQAPEAAKVLFTWVVDAGCKVSIDSDGHHPDLVGCRGPEYAPEEEIRALGIGEDCLWRPEDRISGRR